MWVTIGVLALPIGASLFFQLLQTISLVPDHNDDFVFI